MNTELQSSAPGELFVHPTTYVIYYSFNLSAEKAMGQALFEGHDILAMSPKALDRVRGVSLSMIFQDQMTSLNPYMRVEQSLPGELPSVLSPPRGCVFASRCLNAQARCLEERPELRDFGGRKADCHVVEA